MRGNPPFQLTLVLIGFILLAVPMAKLTFARTDNKPVHSQAGEMPATDSAATDCLLRVRFAHVPKRLSIIHGDRVLLESKNAEAQSPVEQHFKIILPKDGLDVVVDAEWPEGTPDTALTIELEPDGLDARAVTRWSIGARINDLVSFSW